MSGRSARGDSTDDAPDGSTSPSTYPLLLAALALAGGALALVVADAETANSLLTLAYVALAAGVATRFVERVGIGSRIAPLAGRIREQTAALPSSWSVVRRPLDRQRERLSGLARALRSHPTLGVEFADGIRLAVPVTIVAGGLFVAWLWLDPARTVSVWFLVGWIVAILGEVWLAGVVTKLGRA